MVKLMYIYKILVIISKTLDYLIRELRHKGLKQGGSGVKSTCRFRRVQV